METGNWKLEKIYIHTKNVAQNTSVPFLLYGLGNVRPPEVSSRRWHLVDGGKVRVEELDDFWS